MIPDNLLSDWAKFDSAGMDITCLLWHLKAALFHVRSECNGNPNRFGCFAPFLFQGSFYAISLLRFDSTSHLKVEFELRRPVAIIDARFHCTYLLCRTRCLW